MESNKKRPEWWSDPVANWRSRLTDLNNRPTIDETNRNRSNKPISKVFFRVRSNKKCQKEK